MKKSILLSTAVYLFITGIVSADIFGTGDNQFEIDFVRISGATNPTVEQANEGELEGHGIVNNDYRMGIYEITNDQWNKFQASYGTPTGSPLNAYEASTYWLGTNIPVTNVSWYEAAQFVNWLNISSGYQVAYKFTGIQGTSNYTLSVWDLSDAWCGTNLYRHKDAFYFLPTEDEWVKAAYWNGMAIQEYATKSSESLYQGNGLNGGWNYYDHYDNDYGPDGPMAGPWNVGSGSEELNGTYDMMGNVWEWIESPYYDGDYLYNSKRVVRGGSYNSYDDYFRSFDRGFGNTNNEEYSKGFRVASVPEPTTLLFFCIGSLMLKKKRYRNKSFRC